MPSGEPRDTDRYTALRAVLFYVAIVLLLVAIWNTWLDDLLPNKVAGQIGHNSEAYLLAALVCAWIHFVLPWSAARQATLELSVAAGLLGLVIAVLLKNSSLDAKYATLNETMFALAFVLVYLTFFRWGPGPAIALSVAIVAFLLIANDASVVIKGAESWMVLVLAPLSFHVFDRTIVNRDADESHALRLAWMAVLVALPALAIALDGELSGSAEGIRDYVSRANEAFVALLIVHAYFGYWVRDARLGSRLTRTV